MDQDRKRLDEETFPVKNGKNRITLPDVPFTALYISIDGQEGETLSVEEIQVRRNAGYFSKKKFLLSTVVFFIGLCMLGLMIQLANKNQKLRTFGAEIGGSAGRFAYTLGSVFAHCMEKILFCTAKLSNRLTRRKKGSRSQPDENQIKHRLRIVMFLLIFADLCYLGTKGISCAAEHSDLHRWMICGVLLILTGLCQEGNADQSCKRRSLLCFSVIFLLLGCLADFMGGRKFRYAAFCMLMFGGLLCRVWHNMKRPELLLEEFRTACKISFAAVLFCCILFRPAFPGICYTGTACDVTFFGSYLLVVAVVFFSDLEKRRTGILNGIGAACSLYLIWMTQNAALVLTAVLLGCAYLVYWVCAVLRTDKERRAALVINAASAAVLGTLTVFSLRYLLYTVTPLLGMQITFENEQLIYMERTVKDIFNSRDWKYIFYDQILILKEYIRKFNLRGYSYLTKFQGSQVWPCNSFVMVTYRYGILAGVSYATMLLSFLACAIKSVLGDRNFFVPGLAVFTVIIGCVIPVEMPFANMAWFSFYFILCWMISSEKGED